MLSATESGRCGELYSGVTRYVGLCGSLGLWHGTLADLLFLLDLFLLFINLKYFFFLY